MKSESQILNIPIEDIIPNRFQPRLNFDEEGLKELAASIKEHGIIQPLVLRRLGEKYEIIAGERRYKASKMAGLTSVPAIISDLDDKLSAEVAIVENVQRKDLSAIEEAKSYKALLDKGYLKQDELAKKMGLSQSAISNKLRLLSLSPVVQDALMAGKISERHARSLLQVEKIEEQEKWLERIIEERITVKELEKRLKEEKDDNTTDQNNTSSEEDRKPSDELLNFLPKHNKDENVPNKFFNFLEDEQANMSTGDEELEEKPKFVEEEIELLDFVVPNEDEIEVTVEEPVSVNNTIEEESEAPIISQEMIIADSLIDKVVEDIKKSNYNVILNKDENTNQIIYTIKVDKN